MSLTTEATASAPSAHQVSYGWLCEVLRGAVQAEAASGPGIGTIECRATAALNALLAAHPVDRRGRCRSCRRPGALWGRGRRTCLIYWTVHYWLFQPVEALRFRLNPELQVHMVAPLPANAVDEDVTEALPRSSRHLAEPRTEPFQTPAVPPPLPPRRVPQGGTAGPTHGGIWVYSDAGPRSRRGPSDNPSPLHQSGKSLAVTGEMA